MIHDSGLILYCVNNVLKMEVLENRKWMNNRVDYHKNISAEFNIGVHEFINFALA